MNDLITAVTSDLFVEVGKIIEHMKVQQERIADLERQVASAERRFMMACEDLGAINEKLGLDPDDGGAEPIIAAIEELQAAAPSAPAVGRQQWSHVTPRDFVEVATAIMDQHGLMDGLSYEKTEKLCEAMEESFKKLPHPAPQAAEADKVLEALNNLRARVMEMKEAAYTFGESSKETAEIAFDSVLDEIDSMAAQAPVREVPGWISIDDHLPEHGTEVLVFQPEKECKVTALARFTSNVWDYYWDAAHIGKGRMTRPASVTHWLPLPAAPAQQES